MRSWKIAVVQDTSSPCLGWHGLHNGFRGLPGVEVVAHVDSNPEGVDERMVDSGAARHHLDYQTMLDQEKPDIVVLCSRNPFDHFEQIKAAAERGVHIYCEKPMTVSLEEADEIITLTEAHGVKLCMAHPSRYYLPFLTMKAMIGGGEIGTPLSVYGRGKCDHRGGGEDLVVLGTHILDLMTFFFGNPESVMAEVTAEGKPIVRSDRAETVEDLGPLAGDNVYAVFRYPGEIRGVFETRKGLYDYDNGVSNMGISVTGTKGTLAMLFDDRHLSAQRRLRISRQPYQPAGLDSFEEVPLQETRVIPGAEPLEMDVSSRPTVPCTPLFLEANRHAAWDLMKAIEEDRLPVSNQFNARTAQEMIFGIYTSALTQGRAPFPLKTRTHPLKNW
jgi:predicted dehydrogenase